MPFLDNPLPGDVQPHFDVAYTTASKSPPRVVRIDADVTGPLREFYLAEMRPFMEKPEQPHPLAEKSHGDQVFARLRTLLPQVFHSALADLENICEEQRQLKRQQRMHAVLHGWLLTHIPLSFALLVLAIIHIVTALRY